MRVVLSAGLILVSTAHVHAQALFPEDAYGAVTKYANRLRDQNDCTVRVQCARALALCARGMRVAVIELAERLKTDLDADVRAEAALALAEIGPSANRAVPALITALQDKDERVRRRAALALGVMGPFAKDAVPALIKALYDPGQGNAGRPFEDCVRLAAIKALGRIGRDAHKAVPDIAKMLRAPDAPARQAAQVSLAQICPGDKALVPMLIKGLKNRETLSGAAHALALLGPSAKEAVPDLIRALKEVRVEGTFADSTARGIIIQALGEIGPDAAEAVPVLRELAGGADGPTRTIATRALAKIQRGG